MKLKFNDFYGKRIGVFFKGNFMQGVLSKDKTDPQNPAAYIVITGMSLYDEIRISVDSIDAIGLFEESQQ